MQHHNAKRAGVTDKPFDPVTPQARDADAKRKATRAQADAFAAALDGLTYAQLAALYDRATPAQRDAIMAAADNLKD